MRERLKPSQETLTPEARNQIKDLMRTSSWDTKEAFLGAGRVEFAQVDRDLLEPTEATEVRKQTWTFKLEERRDILSEANPSSSYEILLDDEGESPTLELALFEKTPDGQTKRRMWAGTTITLAQQPITWKGQDAIIPVHPISYTEWIACQNPRYAEIFNREGLPFPYAGIGVSVFMETTDGFFPLTRRGIETPVYPGRLYSPGGGPKPGETSTEAIFQEILEETGLETNVHFDPSHLQMLALVDDTHFDNSSHSRPELIAYLPVNVSFRDIEEIQYNAAIKKGQKETDVWAVESFSIYPQTFGQRLIYHGAEMCPPTEAGLAHAALFKAIQTEGLLIAVKKMEEVMKRLQLFRRQDYVLPIERLPLSI